MLLMLFQLHVQILTFFHFVQSPCIQATENQILKKKMLDKIFPDLKTDGGGVATYNGVELSTSAGPCVAQNKMANSPVG